VSRNSSTGSFGLGGGIDNEGSGTLRVLGGQLTQNSAGTDPGGFGGTVVRSSTAHRPRLTSPGSRSLPTRPATPRSASVARSRATGL
jgi:hypothetical protein